MPRLAKGGDAVSKPLQALIVVPAATQAAANATAELFTVTPGSPAFSVPVVASTNPQVITHYASCPLCGPELAASLPALKASMPGSDYYAVAYDAWSFADASAWLLAKGLQLYVPPVGG